MPPGDPQRLGAMWLQSLIDIQDQTRDSAEFLEHVKIDLYPDAVYVFTPKGKILALPRGATPVDFAYAIHSDVGDRTVAAKVNGDAVALRTELRSGDVVEVITAPGARPNPAWLGQVRTGRARAKIRLYLRTMEHDEARSLGEKMLAQALRAEGLTLPSVDPGDPSRPDGRHRPGTQDCRHRGQAAGPVDDGPGAPPGRGDADARPLRHRRRHHGAGRGLHRRLGRCHGAARAVLPPDTRRRGCMSSGPKS